MMTLAFGVTSAIEALHHSNDKKSAKFPTISPKWIDSAESSSH
jgi:hypothetical protein